MQSPVRLGDFVQLFLHGSTPHTVKGIQNVEAATRLRLRIKHTPGAQWRKRKPRLYFASTESTMAERNVFIANNAIVEAQSPRSGGLPLYPVEARDKESLF